MLEVLMVLVYDDPKVSCSCAAFPRKRPVITKLIPEHAIGAVSSSEKSRRKYASLFSIPRKNVLCTERFSWESKHAKYVLILA